MKYALSSGVFSVEPDHYRPRAWGADGVCVKTPNTMHTYFSKKEYAESLEEVKEMFDELKKKKIESLKKQIKRIENKELKIKPLG